MKLSNDIKAKLYNHVEGLYEEIKDLVDETPSETEAVAEIRAEIRGINYAVMLIEEGE